MSQGRRNWRSGAPAPEGGGEHYLSISDLMSGLLAIFLLLVVVFMARQMDSQDKAEQMQTQAEQMQTQAEQLRKKAEETQRKLEELERELAKKVESRRVILGQLRDALKANNIDVEVNPETGDVTIRESVLFGFNSAELGQDGQQSIADFVPTYAKVIFSNEAFVQSIHRIVVEGHTSKKGQALHNFKLSLDRARAVADHIRTGVDFPEKERLFTKLIAAGRGEADALQALERESDRKVMFRFEFTNDQFFGQSQKGLRDVERVLPAEVGQPQAVEGQE